MAGHVLEAHNNCERPHCNICEGGLANCLVCHGAEGSLPTQCPGRAMTHDEQDAVMAGTLDFDEGCWLTPA
jgi:hypothetical protein